MASSRSFSSSSQQGNGFGGNRIRTIASQLATLSTGSSRSSGGGGGGTANTMASIPGLLEELVGLPSDNVSKQEMSGILQTLCFLCREKDPELQSLIAQAIANLVRGDQNTLDHDVLTKVLRSLILMCNSESDSTAQVLWAMGTVVYGNGAKCTQFYNELLDANGLLTRFLPVTNPNLETRRAAANCVGCVAAKLPGDRKKDKSSQLEGHLPGMLRLLVKNLTAPLTMDTEQSLKNVCSTFKAIHSVVLRQGSVDNVLLPELLAAIKLYMFYDSASNLDGSTKTDGGYDPLSRLMPKAQAPGQQRRQGQAQGKQSRLRKTSSLNSSGDSEASASDFWSEGQSNAPRRMNGFKVRHSAMMCAQAVIQCGTKATIFGYWQSFVPSHPAQTEKTENVVRAMLLDPMPKGRIAALGVLMELLSGSKQFLAVATESTKETAFQSHSSTVAAMVRELHRGVQKFLTLEKVAKAQTQGIRCACALIGNTPYERMLPGYIRAFSKILSPLLRSKDHDVRVAVLTCFGKMFSVQLRTEDLDVLYGAPTAPSTIDGQPPAVGVSSSAAPTAPLLTEIIRMANDKIQPPIVKVEALQALCALFETHAGKGLSSLLDVIDLAKSAAKDSEGNIRLHAAKLFGCISKALSEMPAEQRSHSSASFWVELLGTEMPELLQDSLPFVRCSACDCMSLIGEQTFVELPTDVQYLCQTLLLGLTADPVTSVRAAASRAVGVVVLYAGPRDDDLFVMDVANALLDTAGDSNLATRIRASWALGNLCDAFVLKKEGGTYVVPTALFRQLLDATLKAAKDSEKVKPNAMRALGGLGRCLDSGNSRDGEGQLAITAISEALCKNLSSGPVKVRWNAAYAFGNLFKNEGLAFGQTDWGAEAVQSLMSVIRTASNFKV